MSWSVSKIWQGEDVYILGGGNSILKQFSIPPNTLYAEGEKVRQISEYSPYMAFLHDKHVIGVNASAFIGDWVDFLFFGDFKFFHANRKLIQDFKGVKVTCHPRFEKEFLEYDINYLEKDFEHPRGISEIPSRVSWNANSGAASVSLAAHLGAKRIFLLGFDMQLEEGQKHFHRHYYLDYTAPTDKRALPFEQHLIGFTQMAIDAERMGIEINNVNPDSAIEVFYKCTMKEVMG